MNRSVYLAKELMKQSIVDTIHKHQSLMFKDQLVQELEESGLTFEFSQKLFGELKAEDRIRYLRWEGHHSRGGGNVYVIPSSSDWDRAGQ